MSTEIQTHTGPVIDMTRAEFRAVCARVEADENLTPAQALEEYQAA